jgi:hypothetical protein
MQVERSNSDALVVNKLPDGSTLIVDAKNETVFALNATAGAAWDACTSPTTLAEVTESMQRSFDPAINEELAEEALLQLHAKNLVTASGLSPQGSRRQFMTTLGSIAVPLVVALSVADQRAFASVAGSRPTTHPPEEPLPILPLPPLKPLPKLPILPIFPGH